MFGLKGAYFYLIALQITIIKFFKKIYFTSNYYNKSLQSKLFTFSNEWLVSLSTHKYCAYLLLHRSCIYTDLCTP